MWKHVPARLYIVLLGRGQQLKARFWACDKISLNKFYIILSLYFSLLYGSAPDSSWSLRQAGLHGKTARKFEFSQILVQTFVRPHRSAPDRAWLDFWRQVKMCKNLVTVLSPLRRDENEATTTSIFFHFKQHNIVRSTTTMSGKSGGFASNPLDWKSSFFIASNKDTK